MENNRPRGREKNVTGQAASVHKRGEGLNTGGPVGKSDGYQGRKQQYSQTAQGGNREVTRAMGKGGLLLIIILAVVFFLFCGKGKNLNCLGSIADPGTVTTPTAVPQNQSGNQGGLDFSGVLGSLMGGGFSSGGTASTGWTGEDNTGKLNTSVAANARAKRTNIIGNGQDVVTMMVYMCGTDLESKNSMATMDLQEMINAGINNPNLNLIVYTGGCKQWKNNVVSSSVNQIYKIGNGGLSCLVSDDGRDPMTKPSTLTRFINYCTKNFPANRYELIFWDHGGGSVSGYGYDEKNASYGSMSLKGINDALSAAGTTYDFIGFDACLMATLENALMLEPYADYLVASEETEPGVGWYYTNWLKTLNSNTSTPTLQLGKAIVDDFVTVCNQKCQGQKTTLSVVDLAELGATVDAKFTDFAVATTNQIKNDYQAVSDARNNTREFATSSRIDQIDLVHLARNLNTKEANALADAILGAVKYNRTSSNMTNSYGLSIFFPYRKSSKVDSAVATYNAIGIDSAYSRCIQQFASMGVAGQAAGSAASSGSVGASSPIGSLLGGSSGTGSLPSSSGISSMLGSLLGGGDMLSALLGGGSGDFFGRSLEDVDAAAQYISTHQFDPNQLVWTTKNNQYVMSLSEDQWNLVHDLQLNVFFDDGEGYIDLGLDNVFEFTKEGELIGEFDGTWLAIDNQPVAYYYMDSFDDGTNYTITGRVPCLIDGTRANLILVFDNANPKGYIAGARYDYAEGETDTIAKDVTEIEEGAKIDFICDYYNYDGEYQNSYMLGEQMTYTGDHQISNVMIDASKAVATYMFVDIYNREYWTPVLP